MPRYFTLVSVVFLVLCSVPSAFGQGLLGRKYVEIQGGIVAPQDDRLEEIDDIGPLIGGVFNHPLTENLDLNFDVEYSRLAGDFGNVEFAINALGLSGGANYHFLPDERLDPFFSLSAGFVEFDSTFKSPTIKRSERDFEPAYSIGGGVEIDLAEKLAIRPHLLYAQIGEVDALSVGGGINYWWTDQVFGGFVADYVTHARDLSLRLRLGFAY